MGDDLSTRRRGWVFAPMDDVKDSNGTPLHEGDSVTLIKGIHITENNDEVEGRHARVKGLVLRTEFLRKA